MEEYEIYKWFVQQNAIIQALLGGLFTWMLTAIGASLVFFFKSWVLYNLHKGKFNFIFYSTILENLLGILILSK